MTAAMPPPDRAARRRLSPAAFRQVASRWRRSSSGVAAVEFALVLPIMATLLLGMSEVTLAINMDRKLTILARSVADLVSKTGSSMTSAEMTNIFAAATAVLRPYDATKAQMVVSSVAVSQSGSNWVGTVQWSCPKNIPTGNDPKNLSTRATNSAVTVPPGFQSSTTKSFVLVETLLPYTPLFGSVMTGTVRLKENTPWPVRDVDSVPAPSPCPT